MPLVWRLAPSCLPAAWLGWAGLDRVWRARMGIGSHRDAAARQAGGGEVKSTLCELAEERLSFPLGAVILPLPEFACENAASGGVLRRVKQRFSFRRMNCGYHPVSQGPWQ